jgi:hypothetical protein
VPVTSISYYVLPWSFKLTKASFNMYIAPWLKSEPAFVYDPLKGQRATEVKAMEPWKRFFVITANLYGPSAMLTTFGFYKLKSEFESYAFPLASSLVAQISNAVDFDFLIPQKESINTTT